MPIKPSWFDAFFVLRPTLFFPAWTFFLAGYARGQGLGPGLMLVWLGAALGASFILNQLSDRREDRLNAKLWPLWERLIPIKMIKLELGILLCLVILGGIWAGLELSGLLILYFFIAGILYNFPPLRLKSRPILGVLGCAAGILIGYLIGARAGDLPYRSALIFAFPYMLAGSAVTLLTHVPDLKGDRQTGVRTFPAVYGLTKTSLCTVALVVLCILFALIFHDILLTIAALISLPFFIRFVSRRTVDASQLAIKISVFSLAVAVGLTWWPFLAMIALYYFLARWYHRQRLGLDYPSFRPQQTFSEELSLEETRFEEVSAV